MELLPRYVRTAIRPLPNWLEKFPLIRRSRRNPARKDILFLQHVLHQLLCKHSFWPLPPPRIFTTPCGSIYKQKKRCMTCTKRGRRVADVEHLGNDYSSAYSRESIANYGYPLRQRIARMVNLNQAIGVLVRSGKYIARSIPDIC